MSVIKKLFGSGTPAVLAPGAQRVIVDAPSVYGSAKSQLGPKEQLAILNKLSTINKKENWSLDVVFEGEPLRKVEHGARFDDVVGVFFAPSADHFLDFVTSHAKSSTEKQVTVVTSDKDLRERIGGTRAILMAAATWKNAFEGSGRRGGGNSGGRGRGGRGRRRKKSGGGKGGSDKKAVKPRDAVSDLIDLVD